MLYLSFVFSMYFKINSFEGGVYLNISVLGGAFIRGGAFERRGRLFDALQYIYIYKKLFKVFLLDGIVTKVQTRLCYILQIHLFS